MTWKYDVREYDDYEEFSVVNEHQIKLSSLDLNASILKFKSKAYQVTILAKGTFWQMNYKGIFPSAAIIRCWRKKNFK